MTPETALAILRLPADTLNQDQPRSLQADRVKKAYHDALRQAHPDKLMRMHNDSAVPAHSVDSITAAYRHLSTTLNAKSVIAAEAPRHAGYAAIDLDDFEYMEKECNGKLSGIWQHSCRCGHDYIITEADLEAGRDVVQCDGCSLSVKVMFEEAAID